VPVNSGLGLYLIVPSDCRSALPPWGAGSVSTRSLSMSDLPALRSFRMTWIATGCPWTVVTPPSSTGSGARLTTVTVASPQSSAPPASMTSQ
jgi:hypothetical protein